MERGYFLYRPLQSDKLSPGNQEAFYECRFPKQQKKIQGSNTLQAIKNGSLKPNSERLGQCFIVFMLPAFDTGMKAENRSVMQWEATQLGFALAAYRTDHGSYPKNLAELSPQYVVKIPKDIFTNGNLIYRPQENGFLLYSVGINGKDDGGRGYDDRTEDEATKDYDDLSVRVPAKPAQKTD
jgi:hypothetical protein